MVIFQGTQKYFYIITIIVVEILLASRSYGQEALSDSVYLPEQKTFSHAWKEVKEGFEYNIRALVFGTCQDPADSSQNPENDFLKLASYKFNFAFRPDFRPIESQRLMSTQHCCYFLYFINL